MNLRDAIVSSETTVDDNITTTANGDICYKSTLNACLDLFYSIGASRSTSIIPTFEKAFKEDKVIATKIAMYARDVREGLGERKHFRDILLYLEKNNPVYVENILPNIPVIGRWDDLLIFETKALQEKAFELIKAALYNHDSLCAKWMPRKGIKAVQLRQYLKLKPKEYRKLLVFLTFVVETNMCNNKWDTITYNHVPSKAFNNYKKAFARHDSERFTSFIQEVNKGEAKINASTLYPYEIIKNIHFYNNAEVTIAQWEALPNYIGDKKYLPMVDASGSMDTFRIGNITGRMIAWSLGLYCATKNTSEYFRNLMCTFSSESTLVELTGDIVDKYSQYHKIGTRLSTNILSAFTSLLKVAKMYYVPKDKMPESIIIFSDMQFDNSDIQKMGSTTFETIKNLYSESGYDLPSIIFWNIKDKTTTTPITRYDSNTILVSGFSHNIFKQIGKMSNFEPVQYMLDTVLIKRYSFEGIS